MFRRLPTSAAAHIDRRTILKGALGVGLLAGPASCVRHARAGTLPLTGDIAPVHDPCIIRADGLYHLFATGQASDEQGLVAWRTSRDLRHWTWRGPVFDAIPGWALEAIPGTRGIWAPDISFFNGRYHLYYSISTFGSNRSAIGLATTETLDPANPSAGWNDHGPVVQSRPGDDFNAIDANHLMDADGRHWLALGSFWSGIKMFELDPASGMLADESGAGKISIARRPVPEGAPGAVEAPFIIRRGSYYYLFVSYDFCCRGVTSSYYLVVGRAREATGPYLDPDGRDMLHGYGSLLLRGGQRFRGPGHNAVLQDGDADYLVYHAYDAEGDGIPTLRIAHLRWTDDDWPSVEDGFVED